MFAYGFAFVGDGVGHVLEIRVELVQVAFGGLGISRFDSFHGIIVVGEDIEGGRCGGVGLVMCVGYGWFLALVLEEVGVYGTESGIKIN